MTVVIPGSVAPTMSADLAVGSSLPRPVGPTPADVIADEVRVVRADVSAPAFVSQSEIAAALARPPVLEAVSETRDSFSNPTSNTTTVPPGGPVEAQEFVIHIRNRVAPQNAREGTVDDPAATLGKMSHPGEMNMER